MTHVFIVNETTFNIHLQFLFAGTGNKSFFPQFSTSSQKKYQAEKALTEMIADISKVRIGDKVLFYLTGCSKFYGIFQVAGKPFLESQKKHYLKKSLKRLLPFRVLIKPFKVYSKGVSEHQILDDISNITKPYEMCWSMIYRKLTGLRGCSFVTDSEMDRITKILDLMNNSTFLSGIDFKYDKNTQQIVKSKKHNSYIGATNTPLTIDNRLHTVQGNYEVHLQAYIIQNFDNNAILRLKLFPNPCNNIWIGNEVVCSASEQKIDLLTIAETDKEIEIRVVELKAALPTSNILIYQLPWYIKWVDQYIVPNLFNRKKTINIIPTIIANHYKRNSKNKKLLDQELLSFDNNSHMLVKNSFIKKVELIEYDRTSFPIYIY